MKFQEKVIAVNLRQQGYSYPKILEKIRVSKSTISRWLKDIELTPEQKEKLLKGREIGRYIAAKIKKEDRIKRTEEVIKRSKKEFQVLIRSSLFLSGLLLYWAEGDKNKSERVKFTNSDEKMIMLMMRWFREICKVTESKFRIALHIHNLHSNSDIKEYWMRITKIPEKQFHKIYIKKSSLRHRRNILYNGTCSIVVSNVELFRKIVGWKIALLEYFNIPLVVQRTEQGTSNP